MQIILEDAPLASTRPRPLLPEERRELLKTEKRKFTAQPAAGIERTTLEMCRHCFGIKTDDHNCPKIIDPRTAREAEHVTFRVGLAVMLAIGAFIVIGGLYLAQQTGEQLKSPVKVHGKR